MYLESRSFFSSSHNKKFNLNLNIITSYYNSSIRVSCAHDDSHRSSAELCITRAFVRLRNLSRFALMYTFHSFCFASENLINIQLYDVTVYTSFIYFIFLY